MNNDIKWTEKMHSNDGKTLPLLGEGARRAGEGKMFAQQTVMNLPSYRPNVLTTSDELDCHARPADGGNGARNDVTTLVPQYLSALVPSKKVAFTLAEVLITLGIIGVVAAITMPTIIANVQKTILKNQFKSAYSKFSQAVMQTQARMEHPVECSYWINGQYPCEEKCNNRNEYGTCTSYSCAEDGSPLSADHNGPKSQCTEFYDELFNKTLKVVKYCEKNALANGCVTDAYRGQDKVKIEQDPEATSDPNYYFSNSNIKNKFASWVLSDGIVLIRYSSVPTFAIDINGHKGPNKWGYDIFEFRILGDYNGIKKVGGRDFAEEGGTATSTMIKEMFSK